MMNGIIIIDKETGFTSHDVVAKMRGICGQRKIGHTGTLDPLATGVLPVCLGSATKLCDMLADRDKEYETELLLGTETDTQDITGQILARYPVDISEDRVKDAVFSFAGEYLQVPPMYSALKVGGKKLYELARAGKEVERKARPVQIYELEILEYRLPVVRMRVACSKGTYIRTLCADIGQKLGCGGTMQSAPESEGFPWRMPVLWGSCSSGKTKAGRIRQARIAQARPEQALRLQACPGFCTPWTACSWTVRSCGCGRRPAGCLTTAMPLHRSRRRREKCTKPADGCGCTGRTGALRVSMPGSPTENGIGR